MFRFFPLVSRVTPLVWVFSLLAFCLYTALLVLIGLYDIGIGIGPKLLLSGTGGVCVVLAILCYDQQR